MDLSNLGNVVRRETGPHYVEPIGLVTHPDLVIKLYQMHTGQTLEPKLVDYARETIKSDVNLGEITRESGLGFAILSAGYLNVARWKNEPSILPLAGLYKMQRGILVKDNMERGESFCIWENDIAHYEAERWLEFLRSSGTEEDKWAYVHAVMPAQELFNHLF